MNKSRLHIFLLITLMFGALCKVNAQQGDFYLSNHSISQEDNNLDNMNFDVEVTNDGILSIANRKGVVFYDGISREYFQTPGAALSLANSNGGITYVGCVDDFGKIGFSGKEMAYISLEKDMFKGNSYFQTHIVGRDVYFLSDKVLAVYDEQLDSVYKLLPQKPDENFEYMFSFDSSGLYLASDLNLYSVQGTKMEMVSDSIFPFGTGIQAVSKQYSTTAGYLIATIDNKLYSYKNAEFKSLDSLELMVDSIGVDLVQVEWINESLFAVSTLSDGVLIYDFGNGELLGHLDYNRGLPDNEIYDIARDQDQGLWITHEYGLTRVCPEIPVKSLTSYPGLEGNLLCTANFDEELYIGTSQGLFVFTEEKQYENIVEYEKIYQLVDAKASKTKNTKVNAKTESTSKKKKFQLFKKKTDEEKEAKKKKRRSKRGVINKANEKEPSQFTQVLNKLTNTLVNAGEQIKKKEKVRKVSYIKKESQRLLSTTYLYKKIPNIHSKAKQIINFKGQLIITGNGGMHQIDSGRANLIIREPIQFALPLRSVNQLMVSTTGDELLLYDYVDDAWVVTDSLLAPRNPIVSMLEHGDSTILMAGTTSLYRVELGEYTSAKKELAMPNQYFDKMRITELNGQIYLINNQGYFTYDTQFDGVYEDKEMLERHGRPVKHLQQSDGRVWVYDGKRWSRIEKDKSETTYDYFSLFPNMSFIDYYDSAYWIINDQKELIKFEPSSADSLSVNSKMFFKGIYTKDGMIARHESSLVFSYDNNNIRFELSRPDYLGFLNVEYQYKMVGLDKEWSAWSDNNDINFNYLRPNKYKLLVRSKDAFGNIQESAPFTFRIKPPYWQEPWFNMLQVILFASLIFLSSRLNRKGQPRYVWLTRILTVLTLVLVIEFLQQVAQMYLGIQSTPVVEFLINVVVALFVFPVEILLKKIIRMSF